MCPSVWTCWNYWTEAGHCQFQTKSLGVYSMRINIIKRWWQNNHINLASESVLFTIPQERPLLSYHLLPHSTQPFLIISTCTLCPQPITPHLSFPCILNQALPHPGLPLWIWSQLGSFKAKSSTGHLTPSCPWSMLLPGYLLRPLSRLNLRAAVSLCYSA